MIRKLYKLSLLGAITGGMLCACGSLEPLKTAWNEVSAEVDAKMAAEAAAKEAAEKEKTAQAAALKNIKTQSPNVKNTAETALTRGPQTMPKATATFVGTPFTVLPAGTDGTAGKKATYVLFGDWPQTLKAANVTVNEKVFAVMGAHIYYKGSDGCWYLKCKSPYAKGFRFTDGTKVTASTTKYYYFKVEPIKWRVLTNNYNGTGKRLLLAESVLDGQKYYDYDIDKTGLEGTKTDKVTYELTEFMRITEKGFIHHNNYEHSRMRAYLNGISYLTIRRDNGYYEHDGEFEGQGFLQSAFTPELQAKIPVTPVDNSFQSTNIRQVYTSYFDAGPKVNIDERDLALYQGKNPFKDKSFRWQSNLSGTTHDKVFLLSGAEVVRSDYGFTKTPPKYTIDKAGQLSLKGIPWNQEDVNVCYKELLRGPKDYAKVRGISDFPQKPEVTTWGLRTPDLPIYMNIGNCIPAQRVLIINDYCAIGICETTATFGIVPAICY